MHLKTSKKLIFFGYVAEKINLKHKKAIDRYMKKKILIEQNYNLQELFSQTPTLSFSHTQIKKRLSF